jgi:hypothetical protein
MKVTFDQLVIASKLPSAAQAAASLNIQYDTYRKYALQHGLWRTNQAGKGVSKKKLYPSITTDSILNGEQPQYQRLGIKRRLFNEGLKDEKCEMCGITDWHGVKIGLELDHINGNSYDHRLDNLRILCPNCHATTHTYRGRNKASMA